MDKGYPIVAWVSEPELINDKDVGKNRSVLFTVMLGDCLLKRFSTIKQINGQAQALWFFMDKKIYISKNM